MNSPFISCDWGTTHFRLRLFDPADRRILANLQSGQGISTLADMNSHNRDGEFRRVLAAGLEMLTSRAGAILGGLPIVISGMASSSLGWKELAYARLPLWLDGSGVNIEQLPRLLTVSGSHALVLVSGARTESDILRGEETQLLGIFQLDLDPALTQQSLVIMPGTHSKHMQVKANALVDFQTYMTGELFAVMCHDSLLRHSVGTDANHDEPSDQLQTAFCDGVQLAASIGLSAALFRTRTRHVLAAQPLQCNRRFLSGLLIGDELAYLRSGKLEFWPIVLAAPESTRMHYIRACEVLSLSARLTVIEPADVDRLSALGQGAILSQLGGH